MPMEAVPANLDDHTQPFERGQSTETLATPNEDPCKSVEPQLAMSDEADPFRVYVKIASPLEDGQLTHSNMVFTVAPEEVKKQAASPKGKKRKPAPKKGKKGAKKGPEEEAAKPLKFSTTIVVGRKAVTGSSAANVPIDHRCISRRHCSVRAIFTVDTAASSPTPTLVRCMVTDLQSLNGTCVHGVQLYPEKEYPFPSQSQPADQSGLVSVSIPVVEGESGSVDVAFSFFSPPSEPSPRRTNVASPTAANPQQAAEVVPAAVPVAAPSVEPIKERQTATAKKASSPEPAPKKKPAEPAQEAEAPPSPAKPAPKPSTTTKAAPAQKMSPRRVVSGIIQKGLTTSKEKTKATVKTGGPRGTGNVVIVTTGIKHLQPAEEDVARRVGLTVNPGFDKFWTARYLVAEPPMARSVKLLCALPHIEAVVSKAWLSRVLAEEAYSPPLKSEMYAEPPTRGSLQALHSFSFDELVTNHTPDQRRLLFHGKKFWVHHKCVPQDPPNNDLKSVVEHSGGRVTNEQAFADVILVPTPDKHTATVKKLIRTHMDAKDKVVAIPGDVFVAVLRQGRIVSTVQFDDNDTTGEGSPVGSKRGRGAAGKAASKDEDKEAKEPRGPAKRKRK